MFKIRLAGFNQIQVSTSDGQPVGWIKREAKDRYKYRLDEEKYMPAAEASQTAAMQSLLERYRNTQ